MMITEEKGGMTGDKGVKWHKEKNKKMAWELTAWKIYISDTLQGQNDPYKQSTGEQFMKKMKV